MSDHLPPSLDAQRPGAEQPASESARIVRLPARAVPSATLPTGQDVPPGAWALDESGLPLALPFFATPVQAGFPSP
ncbi:MAG: hypothetical protein B7X94_01420, partial [Hydrogenophilales bacterium 17-62-8]